MLTTDKFNEIGGALQRRAELAENKITTPAQDAEKAGLDRFLAKELSDNAAELLGCWHIMESEYKPLVRSCGSFLTRAAMAGGLLTQIEDRCKQSCCKNS